MQRQAAPGAPPRAPPCSGHRLLSLTALLLGALQPSAYAERPAHSLRLRPAGEAAPQRGLAAPLGDGRGRGQALRLAQRLPPRAFRDLEPEDEEFLKRNLWRGQGMHVDFRFMDDLEPVAPMDNIGSPAEVTRLEAVAYGAPGKPSDALYVPPYLNPDAFPVVQGGTCECKGPRILQPRAEQSEWARRVAKQLGVRVSELPQPQNLHGDTRCKCNDTAHGTYHWVKSEPIHNSRRYIISPADITYAAGDYWRPRVPGGIVAPQDKMPASSYPLQASADRIASVPASAAEDRVGAPLAVYIDQLEARSRGCDNASPECTVPCQAGDEVELQLGNARLNATVVRLVSRFALVIEFAPAGAVGAADSVPCPQEAGCSPFRMCYGSPTEGLQRLLRRAKERPGCVEPEGRAAHDATGELQHTLQCPAGTKPCGTVRQMVSGSRLRKDGKACRPGSAGGSPS